MHMQYSVVASFTETTCTSQNKVNLPVFIYNDFSSIFESTVEYKGSMQHLDIYMVHTTPPVLLTISKPKKW